MSESNTPNVVSPSVADRQPQQWWEIARSQEPSQLPFMQFYEEMAESVIQQQARTEMEEEIMSTLLRIADPVADWEPGVKSSWGENASFIEDWFEVGESMAQVGIDPTEIIIEQQSTDHLDRAYQWVKSLAVVTKLVPALGD